MDCLSRFLFACAEEIRKTKKNHTRAVHLFAHVISPDIGIDRTDLKPWGIRCKMARFKKMGKVVGNFLLLLLNWFGESIVKRLGKFNLNAGGWLSYNRQYPAWSDGWKKIALWRRLYVLNDLTNCSEWEKFKENWEWKALFISSFFLETHTKTSFFLQMSKL